jgi:uncharacterized protein (TIGR04255 family)
MNERFDAPPLVEIIAELRWDVGTPKLPNGAPVPMPILPPMAQPYEACFTNFGAAMGGLGFHNSERVVPSGFPWMAQQPVMRYRYNAAPGSESCLEESSLFQLGAGIFTANAIPPYSSWDEFGPIVRKGVEAFLAHGLPANQGQELAPILRYIDAFHENLTNGESLHQFVSRVMGIHVELPGILTADKPTLIPTIQIVKPLPFGNLAMQIAEGENNGQPALILEMIVSFNETVPRDLDRILAAFSSARNEIHSVFVQLTKPIHDAMQLKEAK